MQNVSSKNNEHLIRASELFDGQCHQQFSEDSSVLASNEVKSHLKNWALIRSALRNELPKQVDLNFSDKVMAQIAKEDPITSWVPPYEDNDDLPSMLKTSFNSQANHSEVLLDQASVNTKDNLAAIAKNKKVKAINFKKIGIFASQIAIAASVATVAVIGLQTYNASEQSMDNIATTASNNVGPVVGLSLASYQNNDSDIVLNVDSLQNSENGVNHGYQADLKQKRQEEIEKINIYLKGYVMDTASNQ